MNQNIRYITEVAILTAMITVLGAIKIPNVIPGIEYSDLRSILLVDVYLV